MRLVLGVDGGGSKTHALVADERGQALGFASSGRSNWEDTGLEQAGIALTEAVTGALAAATVKAGDLAASAFGLAGLDWDSDRPMLGALIDPLGLAGPRTLDNDSFIALRAGTSRPTGVVVIAGTGTVAAGRNLAGRTFRSFGLAPMYGDFGSATDVAEEAVHAVADACTGRGPPTTLTELLPPLAGCASPVELLQRLSRAAIELPPAAPLVLQQAAAGDPACRAIVLRAATALGESAAVVACRLGLQGEEFELVMAGGLFRGRSRLLERTLVDRLHRVAPLATPVHLGCRPVVGAVLQALELAGVAAGQSVRERLVASSQEVATGQAVSGAGLAHAGPAADDPGRRREHRRAARGTGGWNGTTSKSGTRVRIIALETLRPAIQPNVLLVQLHTDGGVVGLGEAFFGAGAVEAYLHDTAAPVLLGMEDPTPERAARLLAPYVGYQGGGVETRGNGAVDLALWDLLGKRAGLPVVDLLGGAVRDRIKVYNTCAGSGYVSTSSRQTSDNWGLTAAGGQRAYEDLEAFLDRPGELAKELWAEGLRGMKVWPFDQAAERTGGTDISQPDLERGVAVIEAIREAVGFQMDLMVELHGLWTRPAASRILQALTRYRPFWVEDPIRPDAVDALARLAAEVDVPIATGETCVGRRGFLPLLQREAVDVVTVDVGWTGGLTEAQKVATLADAYGVPVAPHDCTGPVAFATCVHLVLSQPNGLIQETVRAFLRTWYGELVTGLPVVQDGHIGLPREPGLGVRLREGLTERPDIPHRITRL
jgi:galactonate dehydratase